MSDPAPAPPLPPSGAFMPLVSLRERKWLALAIVLALPIPLGNMLPAFAISLMALGVLERDGLWVIIGVLVGVFSLVIVSGVVWALAKALIFVIVNAF